MTEPNPGTEPTTVASLRDYATPTAEALRELALAILAVAPRNANQPAVGSRAMSELSAEATTWKRPEWERPITDTHSLGGMTLLAVADYVHSFADLIVADRTPVYGHLVVARAALESSVISYWLSQPDIEAIERVQRGLAEQLYSALELKRLALEPNAAQRVQDWKDVAALYGWQANDKPAKPLVDGIGRPSIPNGIRDLIVERQASELGRWLWCYLSAVSHVTWWGLRQSVLEDPEQQNPMSPPLAGVGTQLGAVQAIAFTLLTVARKTATARFMLMGWADGQWEAANDKAEQHGQTLLQAIQHRISNAAGQQ